MMSYSEWCDRIHVEHKGKGKSQHYTATCPVCSISYDVDILSSDASARVLATQKIASHIRTAHDDEIADEPKET